MRRAVAIVIVAPFVLALVAPTYWELGLRLGLAALGALVAWALSRRVWTVAEVPAELAPVRSGTASASWPAGADRLRRALEIAIPRAQPDRIDRARGLRRTCRAIAAERLQAHHGLDLAATTNVKRPAVLGDEMYGFLEGGPMIDHHHLVDALERL